MADLTSQLLNEPLVNAKGIMSPRWYIFFRDLNQTVAETPAQIITPVELDAQSASLSTTALPTDSLAPGLYRLSYYTRITQAATISSSLTVTITWTDGSVACSFAGAAITGNAVTDTQTDTLLIAVDQASPISYSTTYVSAGATAMNYKLAITLEAVSA